MSGFKKSKVNAKKVSVKIGEDEKTLEELELFKKKVIEEDRMDAVFRLGQNMTEKFDNRAYLHPHGMTDFDYKSMPQQRRDEFEKFKNKTRHENYQYLSDHPEIDGLLALFFKKLLQGQPPDPVHFAAEYFTRDTAVINYPDLLEEERERLARYRIVKMQAAEKITLQPVYIAKEKKVVAVIVGTCPEDKAPTTCEKIRKSVVEDRHTFADYESPEGLLNWLKKLNIGPIAQDFDTGAKAPNVIEIKSAPKKKKKKKYCGCKDPGRREKAHPAKKSIINSEANKIDTDVEGIPSNRPDYIANVESNTDFDFELNYENEDSELEFEE